MPARRDGIPTEAALDPVQRYLEEIAACPLLSAEQEVELGAAIAAGRRARAELAEGRASPARRRDLAAAVSAGDAARQRFIQSNLRLVVSVAKRYQGGNLALLDLVQEGNLGLIRAVERFDHRKGFKFSTYATWWIRQAIGRAVADKGRTIRLPTHLVDTLASVQRSSSQLLKQLGREPTVEELASDTGLPADRVRRVLELAPDAGSLSATVGDDIDLGDLVADRDAPNPFDLAAGALARKDLAELLGCLADRERQVVTWRFGLDGGTPRTLDEIGGHYGVSRERVRQIEAKALTKLRHPCSARQRRLVASLQG